MFFQKINYHPDPKFRWSTTANGTPKVINGAADLMTSPNIVSKSDAMCTTPLNNNNGSPTKAEDFVASVLGVPAISLSKSESPNGGDHTHLENSTAIFTSPNSDVFTSSPNANPDQFRMLSLNERDLVVMVRKSHLK